jgi:hypothetical protein
MREGALRRVRALLEAPIDPFQVRQAGAVDVLVEDARGQEARDILRRQGTFVRFRVRNQAPVQSGTAGPSGPSA